MRYLVIWNHALENDVEAPSAGRGKMAVIPWIVEVTERQ